MIDDMDNSAEFVAEDDSEFVAQGFFPFLQAQQWVALHPDVTGDQFHVYGFVMAHLNPTTGKFTADFGRKRVAEKFGRSLDWVDKQLNGLDKVGAVKKQPMFWVDAKDRRRKAARSPEPVDPETGVVRAQAANNYIVRLAPPGGAAAFPHAINIGEHYYPERITKRIYGDQTPPPEGGAADQRPPTEQGKRKGGAASQRPGGGRQTTAPGGRRSTAPGGRQPAAQTTRSKNNRGNEGGGASRRPPTPPADVSAGHAGQLVTSETELVSNQQTACAELGVAGFADPERAETNALEVEPPPDGMDGVVDDLGNLDFEALPSTLSAADAPRAQCPAPTRLSASRGQLGTENGHAEVPAPATPRLAPVPSAASASSRRTPDGLFDAPGSRRGPWRDCPACRGDGWVLDSAGEPVEPAVRCACPGDPERLPNVS